MTQSRKLFCPHCGVQVIATASFCHACGRAVAEMLPTQDTPSPTPSGAAPTTQPAAAIAGAPSYRGLRAMNWVVVALVVPSAALLLLRTSQPVGVLVGIPIMALVVGTFLFTALALSRETAYFAGFPIAGYRHLLRKASFVLNAIMLLFGLAGMVACLATQQYGPLLSVLIYVVPPALNLKALRELAKSGT